MGSQPKRAGKRRASRTKSSAIGSARTAPRANLSDALFSSTQQRVLKLLFGQPERSFFTTQLIELAQAGTGAVQRELRRLRDAGLILESKQGNQKHFQANRTAPIFAELRGIVLKTVGLSEPIKNALASLEVPVQLALVYGSVAKQTDTASSDIDLLIVCDNLSLENAYAALAPAEQAISRKVNVMLLTSDEFERRRNDNSPFISKVLAGEYLLLIGEADGIGAAR